jgi:hypothetical protein
MKNQIFAQIVSRSQGQKPQMLVITLQVMIGYNLLISIVKNGPINIYYIFKAF